MKTNAFPPLPTASDWSKLDLIQANLQTYQSKLDNLSVRSDGMGIDQMVVVLERYQSFINDRQGLFSRLFRWFQTS